MSISSDATSLPNCHTQLTTDEIDASERARYREIAAYFSAASIDHDTFQGPSPSPVLSKDITLNALVQLGALRLDTDRSFLSLIDGDFQYIVAESTRQHSLLPENVANCEEPLFLGVCKLDKTFGVCPNTMKAFTDDTGTWVANGPNVICDRTRYVINDFRADPKYLTKPYVSGYPHMVSYLEVPLISPLGYVLGSYCVVDNKRREFNTDQTVNTMAEIASAIMRHLDLVKTKEHRARSEQLIRGLGQFMERESTVPSSIAASASVTGSVESTRRMSDVGSLSNSYGGTMLGSVDDNNLTPLSEPTRQQSTFSQFGHMTTSTAETSTSEFPVWTPPISPFQPNEKDFFESFSLAPEVATSAEGLSADNSKPRTDIPTPPSREPSPREAMAPTTSTHTPTPAPPVTSPGTATHTHILPVSMEIKDALSRAAATIQEAMGMNRVTFLDAVPSGFASRSSHATPHERDEDPLAPDTAEIFADETQDVYCATLSQSVGKQGPGQGSSPPILQMPEAMLQRFLRRYPRGHIFTADDLGPIDCRFGPGHLMRNIQKSRDRTTRHRDDICKLFGLIPDARYIIFLPLWHFQKECFFAAILGHIVDPTFALEMADINLLTAFGNSVMVEVSRFEALAVSRAKSDFISSISHELRSPLHGIMASGELLRDSITDSQCLPLLDMIDSCSTTLLDTFDNLLDFAKINTAVRAMDKADIAFKGQMKSDLPLVNLSALVEDMVETVQLGHSARTGFHPEPEGMAELSNAREGLPDTSVLVTVNIEKRATWMTRIDSGAWKRIIMNLFGNSLKYTRCGHIEVGLSMVQRPGSKKQSRTHICFSIRDTGIGMSPDYIKYHLFTPFAQENTLSPGTGLGLSIVQQITKSLGGEMDVKSLIGIGTQITVLVPLIGEYSGPLSLQLAPIVEGSQVDPRHELRGRSLCCITSDAYRAISGTRRETTSEMRDRARAIKSTIKTIAKDRLGMKITFATRAMPLPDADVYFFDSYIMGQPMHTRSKTPLPDSLLLAKPLVMLCSGSGPLRASKPEEERSKVLHLRHPIGPKKLAAAFLRALEVGKGGPPPVSAPPILTTAEEASYFSPTSGEEHQLSSVVSDGPSLLALPLPPTPIVPSLFNSPLTPSTPVPRHESATDPSIPPPSSLHLLLVDDNPINLKILTTLVKKLKFTFATACNGLEAVHLFSASLHPSKRLFDVVFMDISMPVMNGFEATRAIRKIERENGMAPTSPGAEGASSASVHNTMTGGCQIVALTGLGSEESRQEAFSSGTNLFLTKPVKLAEIKDVLSGTEQRVRRSNTIILLPELEYHEGKRGTLSNASATSSTVTRVSFANS